MERHSESHYSDHWPLGRTTRLISFCKRWKTCNLKSKIPETRNLKTQMARPHLDWKKERMKTGMTPQLVQLVYSAAFHAAPCISETSTPKIHWVRPRLNFRPPSRSQGFQTRKRGQTIPRGDFHFLLKGTTDFYRWTNIVRTRNTYQGKSGPRYCNWRRSLWAYGW
jgi:hypothetical protein